jgi:hypothetical protein
LYRLRLVAAPVYRWPQVRVPANVRKLWRKAAARLAASCREATQRCAAPSAKRGTG